MLELGAHTAIIASIVECCSTIDSFRKRVYAPEHSPVVDWKDWVHKRRPNPLRSVKQSKVPKVDPFEIIRILKEFFDMPEIQSKTVGVLKKRSYPGEIYRLSIMDRFNGNWNDGIECMGGVRTGVQNRPQPYSIQQFSLPRAYTDEEDIEEYLERFYLENDAGGHFVHPKSYGVCMDTPWGDGYEQPPHTFGIYNVRMEDDPELRELWGTGDTIKAYSADEKKKYVEIFCKTLCERYKGEEGNKLPNRVSWYEVSQFLNFYHDTWQKINITGDSEGWDRDDREYSGLYPTNISLVDKSFYQLPGVWDPEDGGDIIENFKAFMDLGIDSWETSIWKRKYEDYCYRLENDCFIKVYKTVYEREEVPNLPEYPDLPEESDSKQQIVDLMSYLFENSSGMKENIYIELSNRIKKLNESL